MKSELVKKLESFRRHNIQNNAFWGGQPFKFEGRSIHGRWVESPDSHLRFAGLSYDILKENHRARDLTLGWYVDHNQDETARGVVYQLPSKDGVCRYLAGIADPYNADKDGTGPCILEVKSNGMPYIYEDKVDAAKNADQFAERYAEICREDDAKQQAEMQIEDKKSEIEQTRNEIRDLLGEMRGEQGEKRPHICAALWATIKRHRSEMHRAWKRIAELQENPWSAVEL